MRESWEYYNDIATRYDYMYEEPYWQLYHMLVERLVDDHITHRSRVLDLGTGTGRWALRMAEDGHDVIGVDPAGEMLKVARMKAELAELKIEFLEVGGENLPFEKAYFDSVLAMGDVLSYAVEPEKVLKKVGEVLKKGGKLLASVDNAWAFLQDFLSLAEYSMAQKLLDERKIPIGDRSVSKKDFLSRPYFPGEMSGILRSSGFELVDMASLIAFYPYNEVSLASNISKACEWEYRYCRQKETFSRSEHLFFCAIKR
ncbi:Methylase involved in ubiquinone/menaquinone biosynthesis [Mesotoga infera]|uniref:Methylase involved in ubiquinone/menaquinone biosynthesis n=1 Tax=Mesotoga infera TaxID=1236046 RepID=A0A7Z7LCQ7_9BACT|nr:class I SAM-dependent methyltransferase [Mesotoga infera]SSC11660.1 Methylase involved in ubiquinone/menaquinone biosynthesis [Mesotoga infera]